jgi:hypothetical protein
MLLWYLSRVTRIIIVGAKNRAKMGTKYTDDVYLECNGMTANQYASTEVPLHPPDMDHNFFQTKLEWVERERLEIKVSHDVHLVYA